MGILWGPEVVNSNVSTDERYNGIVVTANAKSNAALVALGYDVQDSRLTHDVKEALRGSSTGGAFYRFAQLFENIGTVANSNVPSWGGAFKMSDMFDFWGVHYGRENIYWAEYTDDDAASAQEDLEAILNGGTLGGGSGSEPVVEGGYVYFTWSEAFDNDAHADTIGFAVTEQSYNRVMNLFNFEGYIFVSIGKKSQGASYEIMYCTIKPNINGNDIVHQVGDKYSVGGPYFNEYIESGNNKYLNATYAFQQISSSASGPITKERSDSTFNRGIGAYYWGGDTSSSPGSGTGSGDETEDPGPDLDWPDPVSYEFNFDFDTSDIVNVLNQILRDMQNLDRSTGDLVDLSGVISAINGIEHPTTDLSGIEGYLSDILDSLGDVSGLDVNGILGMLGHVHNDLYDVNGNLEDIESAIGNISPPAFDDSDILSAINGLDFPTVDLTDLQSSFDDLLDLAQDSYDDLDTFVVDMLGYWNGLDDEFVAFFTGWDGFVTNINGKWTGLMNKLDAMYRRLGHGRWSEPTGPGIDLPDPDIPWDELWDIMKIPTLEAAFEELMTKFPFVLLNELVNAAMYLYRPAVAPEFDVPAPNPSDWSSPHLVHVSLEQFDVAAAVLRAMIMVWACVRVSNKTIKMWVGDKEV